MDYGTAIRLNENIFWHVSALGLFHELILRVFLNSEDYYSFRESTFFIVHQTLKNSFLFLSLLKESIMSL